MIKNEGRALATHGPAESNTVPKATGFIPTQPKIANAAPEADRPPTTDRAGQARALLEVLREFRPLAFTDLQALRRPPLKIGIRADLITQLPVTDAEAALALRYYTAGFAYLRAMVEGASRIDLDGAVTSTVSAEEAARAAARLQSVKAKLAARKLLASPASSEGAPS